MGQALAGRWARAATGARRATAWPMSGSMNCAPRCPLYLPSL